MAKRPNPGHVVTLEETLTQFDAWRSQPRKPRRIPDDLWGAAVSLCHEHSVLKVSRALRLNYSDLKERFEHSQQALSKQAFVEIGNHTPDVAQAEMFVACNDGNRHRMRIHCRGPVDCAVVDLVKSFFGTTGR
jgi:hypothetical protein